MVRECDSRLALHHSDEEDTDGHEGADGCRDDVYRCSVNRVPGLHIDEGLDVAVPHQVCPDHANDYADGEEDEPYDSAFPAAEVGREYAREEHNQRENEDDDCQERHQIHFLFSFSNIGHSFRVGPSHYTCNKVGCYLTFPYSGWDCTPISECARTVGFISEVVRVSAVSKVLILMGSKSDFPVAEKAAEMLKRFGLDYSVAVASAHRTPDRVTELVKGSGANVFIAIAGMSAALPGIVASATAAPVIGVPVSGKVNMDALLSVVQMPPGIPVAAVGLDRGDNAAILAAEIVGVSDPKVREKLAAYRREMAENILKDSAEVEKLV